MNELFSSQLTGHFSLYSELFGIVLLSFLLLPAFRAVLYFTQSVVDSTRPEAAVILLPDSSLPSLLTVNLERRQSDVIKATARVIA